MRESAVTLRKIRFPGKRSRCPGDRLLHEGIGLRRDIDPIGILYRRQPLPCVPLQLLPGRRKKLLFRLSGLRVRRLVDRKPVTVCNCRQAAPCFLLHGLLHCCPFFRRACCGLGQRRPLVLRGLCRCYLRSSFVILVLRLGILRFQRRRILAAHFRGGDLPGQIAHVLLCSRSLLAEGRNVAALGGRSRLRRGLGGRFLHAGGGSSGIYGGSRASGRRSGSFLLALLCAGILGFLDGRGGQDGPLRILSGRSAVDIGRVGLAVLRDGNTAVLISHPKGTIRSLGHVSGVLHFVGHENAFCGTDRVFRCRRLLNGLRKQIVADGLLRQTGCDSR